MCTVHREFQLLLLQVLTNFMVKLYFYPTMIMMGINVVLLRRCRGDFVSYKI